MHFSTATENPGDNAFLESRLFYPNRGRQCLQFYMYNSGGADDQLNIWVHEYNNESPNGVLTLIQTFRGNSTALKVFDSSYTRLQVQIHT